MPDEFDEALGAIEVACIGPQALVGADAERLEKVMRLLRSGELAWTAKGVQQQIYEVMQKYTAMTCSKRRFSEYITTRLKADG